MRKPKIHELKIPTHDIQALWRGTKKSEIRINDRDFQPNDYILFREWCDEDLKFLKGTISTQITYILDRDIGLAEGYVMLCLVKIADDLPILSDVARATRIFAYKSDDTVVEFEKFGRVDTFEKLQVTHAKCQVIPNYGEFLAVYGPEGRLTPYQMNVRTSRLDTEDGEFFSFCGHQVSDFDPRVEPLLDQVKNLLMDELHSLTWSMRTKPEVWKIFKKAKRDEDPEPHIQQLYALGLQVTPETFSYTHNLLHSQEIPQPLIRD